jgi:hypothetical protein
VRAFIIRSQLVVPSASWSLPLTPPLSSGGGGDPRSLEIEIRRLNSELKSLKSSKMEQESSLRAQNDRIQKLTAKCASISTRQPVPS